MIMKFETNIIKKSRNQFNRNWNINSICSWEMKTSEYGDKRKWNNKERIGYKLDQTLGIILPTRDALFPF
jgi:hypothetical protein